MPDDEETTAADLELLEELIERELDLVETRALETELEAESGEELAAESTRIAEAETPRATSGDVESEEGERY